MFCFNRCGNIPTIIIGPRGATGATGSTGNTGAKAQLELTVLPILYHLARFHFAIN